MPWIGGPFDVDDDDELDDVCDGCGQSPDDCQCDENDTDYDDDDDTDDDDDESDVYDDGVTP